ncbi:MAG TPA: hypothetical protein VF062_04510 [Candidatus Limnocylindrales bacterium]
MSLPEDVDPRLWFELDGCEGRHYLVDGNPHTFRGRMYFYCPYRNVYMRVSKAEIRECSEEANFFIRGFLSGNEPPPPDEDNGDDGDPQFDRWRQAVEVFRRTGYWWAGPSRTCNRCGAELLPSELGNDDEPCLGCPT